jgi:hypothetical protein
LGKIRLCEICKTQIDPDRLDATPDTRLCKEHAIAIQKYGGEFTTSAVMERTSKAGSLKLNYGGVTTTRTRNQPAVDRLREEFLSQ